jgi:pyruvate-formate lyase
VLEAVHQRNGMAMSPGRASLFLDILFERGLREGTQTKSEVQQ